MAVLILLNGPPASGKSTIARRFADARPMTLNLDVDVVRGMLGAWLESPAASGLAARTLAIAMAEAHLDDGHDVIVPQFLARPDFIEQLSDLANRVDAAFVEMALWLERAAAIAAFAQRRQAPSEQSHLDAAALVDRSEHADPVGQMYDDFVGLIERRPWTRRVEVVRGDLDRSFEGFRAALDDGSR